MTKETAPKLMDGIYKQYVNGTLKFRNFHVKLTNLINVVLE